MTVYWELYLLSNPQYGIRFYVPVLAPPCDYFYIRIATTGGSRNKIIPIPFNDYINGMIGKEITDYFYVDNIDTSGYCKIELDRPSLILNKGYIITEYGSSCCSKVYTSPE